MKNLWHCAICVLIASHALANQDCKPPALPANLQLDAKSPDKIQITWPAVVDAVAYEVKYTLRIAEGRNLQQQETLIATPGFVIDLKESITAPRLHLVVEAKSRCGSAASSAKVAQYALLPPTSPCKLDEDGLALQETALSWKPLPHAQSYLICQYESLAVPTTCEESSKNQHPLKKATSLISITPRCHDLSGRTSLLTPLR